MQGRLIAGAAPGIRLGADNQEELIRLRDHWRQQHPEAGAHYLAVRCWGLLIWQPIYLQLIAVHRGHPVLDLRQMACSLRPDGFLLGYSLAPQARISAPAEARLDLAAAQIQALCRSFYQQLSAVLHLSPRAAACIQADCLLDALLRLRPDASPAAHAQALERSERWLARLGLQGRSSYLRLSEVEPVTWAVDCQVCCHAYRRAEGGHCSNCPKLEAQERQARILAEPPPPAPSQD